MIKKKKVILRSGFKIILKDTHHQLQALIKDVKNTEKNEKTLKHFKPNCKHILIILQTALVSYNLSIQINSEN